MPVLEITPEMIGPGRNQLAIAYIAGVMLWPGDDEIEQRDEAMKTATADHLMRSIGAVPAAAKHVDVAGAAFDAVPPRIINRQARERYRDGCIAGEFLAAAVQHGAAGGKVKLEGLKAAITAPARRAHHRTLDFSRSTLVNRILPRFRPVAHLWAAHVYAAVHAGEDEFPCRLADLPAFLALADLFCDEALALRFATRRDALLRPGEAWRIPEGLPLPRLELSSTP